MSNFVIIGLLDCPAEAIPGIVYKHVDPPETTLSLGDTFSDLRFFGDIQLNCHGGGGVFRDNVLNCVEVPGSHDRVIARRNDCLC